MIWGIIHVEECSRFNQYWFSWAYPAEEVSGEFKELGSGQYQYQLRGLCFGKIQMVQRNSIFPEGIRFQDCKVIWGFPLAYFMNCGGIIGDDSLQRGEFADRSSAVMETAFGVSNEGEEGCVSLSKAIRTNSGLQDGYMMQWILGEKIKSTKSPWRLVQGYLAPWEQIARFNSSGRIMWVPGLLWVASGDTRWVQRVQIP